MYDVVTLGETMLRWTPFDLQRIEQAASMEIHVGGSESNTAVGLARLGMRVAWLSRLTRNPLGRKIENAIREHGVDTQHVVWTEEDRVGLYFLEEGKSPRGSQVYYDRKGSAASRMKPSDLPYDLFMKGRSRLFHSTGIMAAISHEARSTLASAITSAKAAGWLTSFDVNYRAKLWTPTEASENCRPLMKLADLIFLPLRDASLLFELDSSRDPTSVVKQIQCEFPQAIIVLTLGNRGSVACCNGDVCEQGIYDADTIGRLGGGDAFSAGFLCSYLSGNNVKESLRWASAAASLKYSIPGDLPLFDRSEVEKLLVSERVNSMVR